MIISADIIKDFVVDQLKIKKLNPNELIVKKNIININDIQIIGDYEAVLLYDNYVCVFKFDPISCCCKINDSKGIVKSFDLSNSWSCYLAKRTPNPEALINEYRLANEELMHDIAPQLIQFDKNMKMIERITNRIKVMNNIYNKESFESEKSTSINVETLENEGSNTLGEINDTAENTQNVVQSHSLIEKILKLFNLNKKIKPSEKIDVSIEAQDMIPSINKDETASNEHKDGYND